MIRSRELEPGSWLRGTRCDQLLLLRFLFRRALAVVPRDQLARVGGLAAKGLGVSQQRQPIGPRADCFGKEASLQLGQQGLAHAV